MRSSEAVVYAKGLLNRCLALYFEEFYEKPKHTRYLPPRPNYKLSSLMTALWRDRVTKPQTCGTIRIFSAQKRSSIHTDSFRVFQNLESRYKPYKQVRQFCSGAPVFGPVSIVCWYYSSSPMSTGTWQILLQQVRYDKNSKSRMLCHVQVTSTSRCTSGMAQTITRWVPV